MRSGGEECGFCKEQRTGESLVTPHITPSNDPQTHRLNVAFMRAGETQTQTSSA